MFKGLNIAEELKGRRTLALAVAGGVLGLAASVLAYVYLEREETALRDKMQAEQSQNLVPVVVAKADLPAGTAVGDGNMAIRHVPKDYVYSETVLPGAFDKVQGQALVKPLAQGQPLLLSYLAEGGAAGLSDKVKEGRRAVTINVDEVSSLNGLILPGDRIDLMLSSRGGGGGTVVPLLQGVKVLATGAQLTPNPDGQPGSDKFGLRYATLTLDVTPAEAERVVLARDAGTLSAILRGRSDDQAAPGLVPMQADQLFAWGGDGGDSVSYIVRGAQGLATIFQVPVGLPALRGAVPAPKAAEPPAKNGQDTKEQDKK